ncbi:hypothetical protein H7H48_15980 [Nitratireductor sp. B36]|uniref:hypothetical protein n=1 Tax=Nitratireductor sp. B36 TaxID=2762059 RepID=UPI001E42C118|nr:hypothetical protein [Nitratireductor sp. B36]MCC5780561.1 hypothetical protein [Nitratireductor sp. B36]
MAQFNISPSLEFLHPWINKPDTEFNENGLYHVDGLGEGPEVEALKKIITAAAEAALAEHTQEMKPGEAKKWSVYVPFEDEEDDEGNPTGRTKFTFKQNAKIKSAKEESGFKDVKIEIRDSKDKVVEVQVWSGTIGRIMFSMRPIVMVSSKQAGVRLDFAKVQIIKLKQGSASSRGFGAVEGGFEAGVEDQGFGSAPDSGSQDDTGGDY